jgi:hypothetical protein
VRVRTTRPVPAGADRGRIVTRSAVPPRAIPSAGEIAMPQRIPGPRECARDQVALDESQGGGPLPWPAVGPAGSGSPAPPT